MAILELNGITRHYGGIVAAGGVDLSLEPGELHCLIGPNGAGKSTLFKLIMGLDKPQSGRIAFNGRDISHLPAYRRTRLGLSLKYQTTRIFQNLSVGQNITIARNRKGGSEDLMHWALGRFRLAQRSSARANTLSYGEQHWLEMCLVLGTAPRVILMDEPTAGMTPEETGETARFIKELNARGPAIMVIEHDMGFVREIATDTTVLHRGRIFRRGSLEEIERNTEVQRIYLGESRV